MVILTMNNLNEQSSLIHKKRMLRCFGTVTMDAVITNFLSQSFGYVRIVLILRKHNLRCEGTKLHNICTSPFKWSGKNS